MFEDVSDAGLMACLKAGQDQALNELVRRWRDRLAGFLYQMTGDRGAALDLTQETFVRLYRSRGRYRPSAGFSSFLFTIAANLARDHARWRLRHPSVELEEETVASLADKGFQPDKAAENQEEMEAMEQAIASLPAELREALLLFVHEGLGYREIAIAAGCSPKAAETRIYRARQLLREKLTP